MVRHRAIIVGDLRHRSSAEQHTVRMIRGDVADPARKKPPIHAAQFGKLRVQAAKNGRIIQPADAPLLNLDELHLLTSLAQAQRVLGDRRAFHADAMLTLTIVYCAGTFDALGVHLPASTLCSAGINA
jgi:hypothetical protein